jgi:Activator of Hsp90 ATPase homolog 1-like protein
VPPGSSLVEIDPIEQPDGTLLRLTHTGLPNGEECAGHAEGWAHYLGRLAEVAVGRDPGPDPWHGRTGRSVRTPICHGAVGKSLGADLNCSEC